MQSYMATYGYFLLKAHNETKVSHNLGPQYNDPHHRIHNSIMHNRNRVCYRHQIPSESPLQYLNYQPIIEVVPRYPNWLIRNNIPVVQVLLIS